MDFSSKQGKRFYAKKRRRRTIISSKDLEKLEGLFKISKWPDRIQKGRLSKAIGKSENFISTWFQNRRARMRRLARQKDLLDEVDTSDSNVQSSDTLHHKLHKYRIKSHSYKIVREEATNHVGHVHERQPKRARETTDVDVPEGLKTSLEGIDLNAELKEQEIKSHDRTKSGNTLGRQFSTEKAIVKMKKAPNDVVPSERRILVETPVCNSTDSTSWENVFRRIVDMMTACEAVMSRSDTSFPFAVKDAALGIRLKDGKLYYSKDYGLDFEEYE